MCSLSWFSENSTHRFPHSTWSELNLRIRDEGVVSLEFTDHCRAHQAKIMIVGFAPGAGGLHVASRSTEPRPTR